MKKKEFFSSIIINLVLFLRYLLTELTAIQCTSVLLVSILRSIDMIILLVKVNIVLLLALSLEFLAIHGPVC